MQKLSNKRNKRKSKRAVFLSSTYSDLREVRLAVATYLWCKGKGIRVIRSEDPGFSKESGGHKHNICLESVRQTPRFLLIIDGRGGEPYEGRDQKYKDEKLTITHAETREAFKKKTGWACYVTNRVFLMHEVWVHNDRCNHIDFEGVDRKVFHILDEIQRLGKWCEFFDSTKDLLPKLRKLYRV